MWRAPQGVHDFMRAYYHHKSADWAENRPYRLAGWTATEVAKMPTYYIMDLDMGMAETVALHMPTPAEIAANRWLPDRELHVYAVEYERNGFQGGLQWYRSGGVITDEPLTFAGRTIDIPSLFIAGSSDWGAYQRPGSLERMQESACTDMRGVHFVDGAGHWVQQEQPEGDHAPAAGVPAGGVARKSSPGAVPANQDPSGVCTAPGRGPRPDAGEPGPARRRRRGSSGGRLS